MSGLIIILMIPSTWRINGKGKLKYSTLLTLAKPSSESNAASSLRNSKLAAMRFSCSLNLSTRSLRIPCVLTSMWGLYVTEEDS